MKAIKEEKDFKSFLMFMFFFAIFNACMTGVDLDPEKFWNFAKNVWEPKYTVPYEYWNFVRLAHTLSALFILHKFSKHNFKKITDVHKFIFLFIAVLFNPIFIIELTRFTWFLIHIVYGFYFLYIEDISGSKV